MDGLEDRVRALEKRVGRYRIINRILNVVVAMVLVACAAHVVSTLLSLKHYVEKAPDNPEGRRGATIRVQRLEIMDEASSRPVCVLRAEGGGGRLEVIDRLGRPLAGFDGNAGLVVRSVDGARFPETRPPR